MMGKKDEAKLDYVDCPKAGHYKHLVICAIGCPFKGGNKKCQVWKQQMRDNCERIQTLVAQYNEKYGPEVKAEKKEETVGKKQQDKSKESTEAEAKATAKKKPPEKPKAPKKAEPQPKAKTKKQPKKKKEAKPTPTTPQFVFVDSTGVVTLLETFDPSSDTLTPGRVFRLGAEVKRKKDAKTGENKRRQKRTGPKETDKPATAKPRKSRRKVDTVAEKKPKIKIRVPKRRGTTTAKKEKK